MSARGPRLAAGPVRRRPATRVIGGLVLAALLASVAATSLAAQGGWGSTLEGRVTDVEGFPLPGVEVIAEREDPSAPSYRAATDADGRFFLHNLPPGRYRVTAYLAGFSETVVEATVGPGRSTAVEIELASGWIEEVVTVAASSPLVGDGAAHPTWNSWLELQDATAGDPVERLEAGKSYDFYLDLAPLAYRLAGIASTEAGSGLVEEIERAIAAGRLRLTAQVRPVTVGRAVRLLGDRLRAESWRQGGWTPAPGQSVALEIRLANLTADTDALGRVPGTGADWRADADRIRAGGIRFPIEAVEAGCAAITLSIWDQAGRVPLDHVVHTVTVGDGDCPPADGGGDLRAGFVTLLWDSTAADAQAALHLFELAAGVVGPPQTVAVFVPQGGNDDGEDGDGGCEFYSWVSSGTLSRYLFEQRAFRAGLKRAWGSETDRYPRLARQLRNVIFPTRPDGDCGGWTALAALRRLTDAPERSLYVRAVDPFNRNLFLPLRLLFPLEDEATEEESTAEESAAARVAEASSFGLAAAFAREPALRQPLPVESYGDPNRCVGDWKFLLPERLHGYRGTVELPEAVARYPGRLTGLEELASFFDDWWDAEPVDEAPAIGLVILAHHVDGALSTEDPDDPWLWSELDGVRVPSGSVAVLSVCSAGDLTRSRELVSALSQAGFDTIVLSPFEVYTPFGIELASRFARRVVEGMVTDQPPTVFELYQEALAETVTALEPRLDTRARGMARELVFAGHGGLRLCPVPGR